MEQNWKIIVILVQNKGFQNWLLLCGNNSSLMIKLKLLILTIFISTTLSMSSLPYFDCLGLLVSLASMRHGLLEFNEMIFAFF